MRLIRPLVLSLCGLLACGPVWAGARDRLEAFSRGLSTIQSDFQQRVFDPNGRQTETSSGVVMLKAPRQFRWEYRQPFPQTIVADGDQIWIYDPDLEQVTVRNQSYEEQSSPLSVLIDPTELDRQFVAREGGHAKGMDWLELVPKKTEDAPFQKARLGFGSDGLQRMELFDSLGQRTELDFPRWQRNPGLAADTFRFVPPPGVEVVGDTIDHAEVMPIRE